jgi:hypothetical protein
MDDDEDLKLAEDLEAIIENVSEEESSLVVSCIRTLKLGRSLTMTNRRKLKDVWKRHLGGDSDDEVDENDFV